jgi:hypothetical protein
MEIGKFLIKQVLKSKGLSNKIIIAEIDIENDSIIISINGEKGKELKYSEEEDNPVWQTFINNVKKEINYKSILFYKFIIDSVDKFTITLEVYYIDENSQKNKYIKTI